MKLKILLLFFLYIPSLYSLELLFEPGLSEFNYAEVGNNSKDDLYVIKSLTLGLKAQQPLSVFDVGLHFSAQLPYNLVFKDVFGEDPANYLGDLFYYGLNGKASLSYPVSFSWCTLSPGLAISWDYFYFRDAYDIQGAEFIYSVVGNSILLGLDIPVNKLFSFGFKSAYSINYFPLHERGEAFKWSYNIESSLFFSLNLF